MHFNHIPSVISFSLPQSMKVLQLFIIFHFHAHKRNLSYKPGGLRVVNRRDGYERKQKISDFHNKTDKSGTSNVF